MPSVEEGRFQTEGSVHLDALRGAAALVVVLGHTRSLYFSSLSSNSACLTYAPAPPAPAAQSDPERIAGAAAPSSSDPRITIGHEAVMIFFVLSGFLVGGSVIKAFGKRRWSWRDYLSKRLTRLWVVLIPALLLSCLLDRGGLGHFAGQATIYSAPLCQAIVTGNVAARLTWPVLLGNLFFTQGILVQDYGVNESLWSLAYEFWYYLLFPLLALSVLAGTLLRVRLLCLACAAAVAYFVGPAILALFPVWVLGAGVAAMPEIFLERTARRLAAVAACTLILAMPLIRRSSMPIYLAEWSIALLSAVLIYFLKHLTSRRKENWYSAISGFTSRISYTLYLVHLPLAVYLCALLNRPWHIWTKSTGNLLIWAAGDAAVVAFAFLFYRAFEANTDIVRRLVVPSGRF